MPVHVHHLHMLFADPLSVGAAPSQLLLSFSPLPAVAACVHLLHMHFSLSYLSLTALLSISAAPSQLLLSFVPTAWYARVCVAHEVQLITAALCRCCVGYVCAPIAHALQLILTFAYSSAVSPCCSFELSPNQRFSASAAPSRLLRSSALCLNCSCYLLVCAPIAHAHQLAHYTCSLSVFAHNESVKFLPYLELRSQHVFCGFPLSSEQNCNII
jgi:hypothetical protein